MFTTIAGVRTQYQLMGHGPAVVMLHGWGNDWQAWHTLIGPLSETHQLLIPDLPAFGQSADPGGDWDTLNNVEWLKSLLDKVLPGQKIVLVGHSYGGKVAALFAVRYAKYLHKLVLIDSSGLPAALTLTQQLKQTVIKWMPGFLKQAVSGQVKQQVLKNLDLSTDHANSSPKQRQILRTIVHENILEQLHLITTPTLLIWGENDLDTPPSQAYQFNSAIHESQLKIVAQAGHFPFIDQPHQVVHILQAFI